MGVEWRKGHWYLRFKAADGKWRYRRTSYDRPTGEHRRAAMRLFYDLERTVLEPQRLGLAPAPSATTDLTFKQAVGWWLSEVSPTTRSHRKNASAAKRLLASPFAGFPVSSVTRGAINEWLARASAEGLAPQTVNHMRAYVSRVYGALAERGMYEGVNPAARATRRRVAKRLGQVLRGSEASRLLAYCRTASGIRTQRRGRVYAAALYTGMRASELHRLTIADLDLAEGLIYVREPKSGAERIVPIHSALWEPLLEAVDEAHTRGTPYVFPGRTGQPANPDRSMAAQLRKDLAAAGVSRRVTFHDLRRTWATRSAECGVSTRARRVMGWTGPTGSVDEDVYTALDAEALRVELEKLHYPTEEECQVQSHARAIRYPHPHGSAQPPSPSS
jgi:integrase